jgi:predicted phosphodiesterase
MLPDRIPDPLGLISDVHANQEALEAVLREFDRQGVRDVWCLGDTLGYGPSPVECLTAIRERCALVLQGNHDYGIDRVPARFNHVAAEALQLHTEMLRDWQARTAADWDPVAYLHGLPHSHRVGNITFVHSSPRDPLWEYLFVGEVYHEPERLEGVFDFIERACFCGHTHFPGGVLRAHDGAYVSVPATKDGSNISLPVAWKAYVNIGSVGQPRDGDARAICAVLRDDCVFFHRVAYDYRKTMAKIAALPRIDPRCGERLAEGL